MRIYKPAYLGYPDEYYAFAQDLLDKVSSLLSEVEDIYDHSFVPFGKKPGPYSLYVEGVKESLEDTYFYAKNLLRKTNDDYDEWEHKQQYEFAWNLERTNS